MNNKKIKVTYYSDDGHGWYAVKRQLIHDLMLLDKITDYSYQKGLTVYLEEDQDASTFFNECKELGLEYEIKKGKNYNGLAPIRGYNNFTLTI